MGWYKGDLHTHDVPGRTTSELVAEYKAHGYGFIVLETKDEDQEVDIERYSDAHFVAISGVEQGFLLRRARPGENKDLYGHINAFPLRDPLRDMDEVWVPEGVRLLQQVAPNAILQLNHPCDGRWQPADLKGIFDQGICMLELNPESHNPTAYALRLWDEALAQGYRIWAQFSSDLHGGGRVEQCGHIMVRAPRLEREAILRAIRKGDFYAREEGCTASVTAYRLQAGHAGGLLSVKAPGAARITFVGPGGKVLAEKEGRQADFLMQGIPYVRVEVADPQGKRLYLQPVWLADVMDQPVGTELSGRPISLRVDERTGRISGVMHQSRNLLLAPAGLRVKFAGSDTWHEPRQTARGEGGRHALCTVGNNERSRFSVRQVFHPVSGGWEWTVEVSDRGGKDREAELLFALPVVGPGWRTWLPNGLQAEPHSPRGFSLPYRRCHDGSPGVPVFAAFQPNRNVGVALAPSPETPFPEMDFISGPEASFGLRARHVRLPAHGTVRFRVHIFTFAGAPEAAYDCYLRRYPALFRPANPKIEQARGAWWCANPFVDGAGLDAAQRLGIVYYQIHTHYPQMGEYWTPQEQWTTSLRQRCSREQVTSIIGEAHARGMRTFLYTCSCECAWRLAEEKYPESICRDRKGEAIRGWWWQDFEGEHCYLMNPDPRLPYGKSLLYQIGKLLETYPETDGIFIDRTDYAAIDYGHDDGLTMVDGRPAYQQAFGISHYLAAAARLIHARGKAVMMNVPFYIEAARYADGVCADMRAVRLPIFRYLAGSKPAFYIYTDDPAVPPAGRVDTSLRWGVYPDWVSPAQNTELYQAARPFMDRAARAQPSDRGAWLGISQAGMQGQLLREGEGWLVTLVGRAAEPVRVTVQGAGEVRRAALITAQGRTEYPVRTWGQEHAVDLPAMAGPALLELR